MYVYVYVKLPLIDICELYKHIRSTHTECPSPLPFSARGGRGQIESSLLNISPTRYRVPTTRPSPKPLRNPPCILFLKVIGPLDTITQRFCVSCLIVLRAVSRRVVLSLAFYLAGQPEKQEIRRALCFARIGLLSNLDPGGKVNFPAQNERMQFQNERRFRLCPQDQIWVSAEYSQDLQSRLRRRLRSKRERREALIFSLHPRLEASQNVRSSESQRNCSSARLAKAARLSSLRMNSWQNFFHQ